jgi:hypothetical protein
VVLQVAREDLVRLRAVLEARQVFLQFRGPFAGQRIDHPITLPFRFHQPTLAQIGEVLRDFDLRFPQNLLEMADAEGRLGEQMQNPQPGAVAKALIDLDEIHSASAAGGTCGAAASLRGGGLFAALLGQALGAPFPENDVEIIAGRFDCGHRILRDDATIVFDFDLQVIVRQHSFAELEDFGEPIRAQAVAGILADVGLEQGGLFPSGDAPAIDEILRDMTYFRDVGVGRDGVAIR